MHSKKSEKNRIDVCKVFEACIFLLFQCSSVRIVTKLKSSLKV